MRRADDVLDSLVVEGTLTEEQARAVRDAYERAGHEREHGRRRILAEILSYVGGAVIVVSAAFIMSQAWEPLGVLGRSLVIGGVAALLFGIGWVLGGRARDDSSRRLASTLMTAAGLLAALTVWDILDATMGGSATTSTAASDPGRVWVESFTVMCAGAAALAVTILGYLRSRSALGHIAAGAATAVTALAGVASASAYFTGEDDLPLAAAVILIILGSAWVALSLRGLFAEPLVGQFVGMVTVFVGTQTLRASTDVDWVVPLVVLACGLVLMSLYGAVRQWPLLVGGVAGVVIGGTELLIVYTEGIVAAVGSLVLGLVMLAVGLALAGSRRSRLRSQ